MAASLVRQALRRLVKTPAAIVPAAAAQPERELRIDIWPGAFARYYGSRSQLEAEGLIPTDINWPERTDEEQWEANNLRYSLRRSRPKDLKGPMKLWTSGDYWCLDISKAR